MEDFGLLIRPSKRRVRALYGILSTHNNLTENSLYLNLGYWQGARVYDEACRNLAMLLGGAAPLNSEDEVLDVGFGFGDQDLLWMETFSPRRIVGLNITPSQVEVAWRRVVELHWEQRIAFHVGSATCLPFKGSQFHKVMALETSFHFDTREEFFREAFRVLRPGGRLALTDIIPLPKKNMSFVSRVAEYMGKSFLQIPAANLYPQKDYVVKLHDAGFEKVDVESIRDHVFEPFARYARGRLRQPEIKRRMHPLVRAFWKAGTQGTSAFDGMDYIIATADKG